MSKDTAFPGTEWDRSEPGDVGLDAGALTEARRWMDEQAGDRPHRVVVVRRGRVAAEWCHGTSPDHQFGLASATKSLFSCILAVAVREGKVGSIDDAVVDYYPQMMDVPDGCGPKPGRFAKPEDRAITFRQLISNTSGYMKPGETPGATFHYQTFGMNILSHAIATAYGLWDSDDPGRLPGIGALIESKIRDPIGGTWGFEQHNFDHPPEALVGIFGHYTAATCTALDMARIGLLWLHGGRWRDAQVVPEGWVAQATTTEPAILANCPEDEWCYGLAFWTNEHGKLWPSLPRDAFAASGAGRQHIWVCPSLDMVITQSPGVYENQRDEDTGLLKRVTDAVR